MKLNIVATKSLNALQDRTSEVLVKLSECEIARGVVLCGGSALAIHLHHRNSEDLDFFTPYSIDKDNYISEITDRFQNVVEVTVAKKQIDLEIDTVKVTFHQTNWDIMNNCEDLFSNLKIANLTLLTAMKVSTLFQRAKYRDYYDLYTLNKELFSLEEIYSIGKLYKPTINKKIFEVAIIFTDDIIEDNIENLKPKYKVSKFDISKHFENEIKKWNG
jgi:predicted nucleotidyltransferase component of viral defense system